MVKFSKFSRRQRKRAGRSASSRVIYWLPKMPKSVEPRSPEVDFRLRCVQHALGTSVAAAADVVCRSLATVYRWVKAFRANGVRGPKAKSTRPKTTRKHQWSAAAEEAVLRLRHLHRRAGKAKLRVLLLAEGIDLSESTIGRILASLKRRNGWLNR